MFGYFDGGKYTTFGSAPSGGLTEPGTLTPKAFDIIGLRDALRKNAGDGSGILMDSKDTTFLGYTQSEIEDNEVINAVKSIPGHY